MTMERTRLGEPASDEAHSWLGPADLMVEAVLSGYLADPSSELNAEEQVRWWLGQKYPDSGLEEAIDLLRRQGFFDDNTDGEVELIIPPDSYDRKPRRDRLVKGLARYTGFSLKK